VGPSRGEPGALRVLARDGLGLSLPQFLLRETARAEREGAEGLRVVHLPGRACAREALADEPALPRRFAGRLTMLCVYTAEALARVPHPEAWCAAAAHARILYV
jgi:hypothetical protein